MIGIDWRRIIAHFPLAEKLLGDRWDKNWKQRLITYNYKREGIRDIRSAFKMSGEGDFRIGKFVEDQGWNTLSNDNAIWEITKWCNNHINYKTDSLNYGKAEYWNDAYGLLKDVISGKVKTAVDDCDGYAVAIATLAWNAGIPRHRLKLAAGWAGDVGHAYILYLREKDNRWYTIEGSYYPIESYGRWMGNRDHSQAERYGKLWWTTTDKKSWAQRDVYIQEGLK